MDMRLLFPASFVLLLLILSGCTGTPAQQAKHGLALALSESPAGSQVVAYFDAKKLLGNDALMARLNMSKENVDMAKLIAKDAAVCVLGNGKFAYSIGVEGGDITLTGSSFLPQLLKRIEPDTDTNFTASSYRGQKLYSNGKMAYFVSSGRIYVGDESAVMAVADVKAGDKSAEEEFAGVAGALPVDADFSAVTHAPDGEMGQMLDRVGAAGYLDGNVADTFVVVQAKDGQAAQMISLGLGQSLGSGNHGGIAVKSVETDGNMVYLRLGIGIGEFEPSNIGVGTLPLDAGNGSGNGTAPQGAGNGSDSGIVGIPPIPNE